MYRTPHNCQAKGAPGTLLQTSVQTSSGVRVETLTPKLLGWSTTEETEDRAVCRVSRIPSSCASCDRHAGRLDAQCMKLHFMVNRQSSFSKLLRSCSWLVESSLSQRSVSWPSTKSTENTFSIVRRASNVHAQCAQVSAQVLSSIDCRGPA